MIIALPIPKPLLPHSIVVKVPVSTDVFGTPQYLDNTVSNVRVEPDKAVSRSKNGVENKKGAVLYYDCVNSSPRSFAFCADQLIVFDGVRYAITEIRPVVAAGQIHHYRIKLI